MNPNIPDADAALASFASGFAPDQRTLPLMLSRQAERFPERTLFRAGEVSWTFAQTRDVAAGMAARLSEAGLAPGDRVALVCGNGPALMQAYLGCAWAGIIAVPINTASRGAQLEHILRNCGARLAVVDAEFLAHVVATNGCGAPLERLWIVGETDLPIPSAYEAAPLPAPGAPAPAHPSRPGDTVAILYTSGTTGPSKGVCCPQAQYFWWAAHTAALLGLGDGETLADDAAALPHQCAQLVLSGAAHRFDARRREALLRIRFPALAPAPSRERDLSARRHGSDAAFAPRIA